jgi:ribosomal protein L35
MPKNKPKKSLLKRVRFTKNGLAKVHRAYGRHKRSHKSGTLLRSYRRPSYVAASDMGRVRKLALKPLPRRRAGAEPTSEPLSAGGT